MNLDIWIFFEKKNFRENSSYMISGKNNGYFTWGPIYIFLIISCSILLRMRNVSDYSCSENQNTRFVFSDFFFRKSCRLWHNVGEKKYGIAGQATDTHSEHVILIAFPPQQWLHERASVLYVHFLSCFFSLTLILLTWRIWWAPNNASKWHMGFNSAFKGL